MALIALGLATVGAVGCGEEEGVAEGAVVTAYVEAPLCGNGPDVASVQTHGGDAVRVKFVCIPSALGPELGQGVGGGNQLDLARVGENARRASEDSRTIAYVGEPGAARFARPVLEAAGIAFVPSSSANRAMRHILDAVSAADPNSLRDEVRETLDPR